jgi:hypothetical protein
MHKFVPAIITVVFLASAVLFGFLLEARRIRSVIAGEELKPPRQENQAKSSSKRANQRQLIQGSKRSL